MSDAPVKYALTQNDGHPGYEQVAPNAVGGAPAAAGLGARWAG